MVADTQKEPSIPIAAKLPRADKVASGLVGACIFCWAALVNWRLRLFVPDDAYIHIRIASHLANTGHGWFNLGERVMVTSSPLWTAVLAVFFTVFGERPWIIPVLNAFLLSVAWGLGSFDIIACLGPRSSGAKRVLAYSGTFLIVIALLGYCALSQMETVLAVCLMLGAITAFLVDSDWALALLVLAAFTRYEMVLSCAAFLIAMVLLRQLTFGACLRASFVAVVGVVFLVAQYRTVIPNSVHAKAVGYSISNISAAVNLLWDGMIGSRYSSIILVGWSAVLAAIVIALFKVLKTSRKEWRNHWPMYTAFFSGLLILLAYFVRPTLLFAWYRPMYTVPIVLGVLFLALQQTDAKFSAPAFALLILVWGYHYWMVMPGFFSGAYVFSPNFGEAAVVHRYLTIGRTLDSACPDSTLLSSEIGGLGESFHGTIIDGFGLATPEAIQFQPLRIPEDRSSGSIGAFSAGIVDLKKPDVIVTYEIFAGSFLRSPLVNDYYRIQIPPNDPSDRAQIRETGPGNAMFIFLRKNGKCQFDPTPLLR
jgi:hypothetical protein